MTQIKKMGHEVTSRAIDAIFTFVNHLRKVEDVVMFQCMGWDVTFGAISWVFCAVTGIGGIIHTLL